MKLAALLLLLTLAAAAEPGWQVGPKPGLAGPSLVLSPTMDEALRAAHPTFRLWRLDEFTPQVLKYSSTPFAVVEDFNGDKRLDAALHGRTEQQWVVTVVLSSGQKYTVHDLQTSPHSQNGGAGGVMTLVELVRPGRRTFVSGPPLDLRWPAVEYTWFGKGSYLYYWNGKRFQMRDANC